MRIEQVICQVLRLESVENKTASSQDAVLVRVRTDTGLEGVGEADSSPEVVKATQRQYGMEVAQAEAHFAALKRVLDRDEPDYKY